MRGVMLEMKRYSLKNIGTKFLPGLCLGEDGMAQRAREITAFLSIVNFEDQFHASRIPEAEEPWHLWALRNQVGPKVCRVRVGIRGFLYGQLGDQGVVRPSELALPLIPTFCPQPQIFDAIPPASTLKAPSMTKAGTEHIVRNSREAEHRLLVGCFFTLCSSTYPVRLVRRRHDAAPSPATIRRERAAVTRGGYFKAMVTLPPLAFPFTERTSATLFPAGAFAGTRTFIWSTPANTSPLNWTSPGTPPKRTARSPAGAGHFPAAGNLPSPPPGAVWPSPVAKNVTVSPLDAGAEAEFRDRKS